MITGFVAKFDLGALHSRQQSLEGPSIAGLSQNKIAVRVLEAIFAMEPGMLTRLPPGPMLWQRKHYPKGRVHAKRERFRPRV